MTHQDFVIAWITSKSEHEVSAKTGWDTHKVSNIAAHMRYKGVVLPRFPHKGFKTPARFTDKLDVQALNKFILER